MGIGNPGVQKLSRDGDVPDPLAPTPPAEGQGLETGVPASVEFRGSMNLGRKHTTSFLSLISNWNLAAFPPQWKLQIFSIFIRVVKDDLERPFMPLAHHSCITAIDRASVRSFHSVCY